MTTTNMGLTIPTPTVTPGPAYAVSIAGDLAIIDVHDHSPGNGAPISNNVYIGMAPQTSDPLGSTTGQGALFTSAAGNLEFHNPVTGTTVPITGGTSNYAALNAHRIGGLTIPHTGGAIVIPYNVPTRDTASAYNSSTGVFTAPATGDYMVVANAAFSNFNMAFDFATTMSVYVNSASVTDTTMANSLFEDAATSLYNTTSITISAIVFLNIADQLTINMLNGASQDHSLVGGLSTTTLSIKQLP